ncbi:hypothetical protein NO932_06470 [Pelagibacterium sp. 26DY04]|uniref:hypothetical protein n=1 Tax=Pelagibacterium sp. 26DY04 TaxID=2967130 RepID=UPI002815E3C1|nr:hypothetical protein [Pelagibacterium sp. 26DY04]WMT88249.1 hypothetical protein NO932_06470 [Pelagibacterium sp. 26DY04]
MREMFVTHHVLRFLNVESDTPKELVKKAMDTRGALDAYMANSWLTVAMNPDEKPPHTQLARNKDVSDGIWSFRIRDPKPHVRVLGAFADRDHFVAIDYRGRDGLDFDKAVEATLDAWGALFPGISPITGDNIELYLSDRYRLV